jgi:hypothetical protein
VVAPDRAATGRVLGAAGKAAIQLVKVQGAADKAASLVRCESSAVNCLIRTASISDAQTGNALCSART